jgi:hypothetical protein
MASSIFVLLRVEEEEEEEENKRNNNDIGLCIILSVYVSITI